MTGKVLFVDDDRNIRSAIERLFFDDDEIAVRTAGGATLALEMLEEDPADVVVSDQMMPEMDGITLLQEVRRRHPETRLMMLTGYGEAMADQIEAQLGADMPVFGKPWHIDNLRDSIRGLLAERAGGPDTDSVRPSAPEGDGAQGTQGMLAAGMAHELRGPLGFIRSNLEVLDQYGERLRDLVRIYERLEERVADRPEVADIREELQGHREANRTDYILSDQADLIRQSIDGTNLIDDITAALGALSPSADRDSVADVAAAVDRAFLIARYEIKHSVAIVRETEDLPPVACNPTELTQILLNLLINAAEAVGERGTVSVRAEQQDDQVAIEVADDGCGIADEHRGRIFEPFFTTKGSTAGLGLALVADLVRRNDGMIGVRSEVGEGACFRIEFPLVGAGRGRR